MMLVDGNDVRTHVPPEGWDVATVEYTEDDVEIYLFTEAG